MTQINIYLNKIKEGIKTPSILLELTVQSKCGLTVQSILLNIEGLFSVIYTLSVQQSI